MKQSMIDVFVAAAVATVVLAMQAQRRRVVLLPTSFAAATLAAGVLVVGWAAARGTAPLALWDAVFSFRAEASAVIAAHAPPETDGRAGRLALAFAASGGIGLLVALLPVRSRRMKDGVPPAEEPLGFRAVTLAVVVWELVAVAAGGSWWLHYLVGTVPGLVLLSGVACRHRVRMRVAAVVTAYGAVAAVVTSAAAANAPMLTETTPPDDVRVGRYLDRVAPAGDTAVVAFGSPFILEHADLECPYPLLWSLPVRVRDPELARFTRLLRSHDRPTWVVVHGESLASWGVDAARAEPVLERHYLLVREIGEWHVWRQRSVSSLLKNAWA